MNATGFQEVIDQGILVAEGDREGLLQFVTNLAFPRLLPTKTFYVSGDDSFNNSIKKRLGDFGFETQFVSYNELGVMIGKEFRGKSVVLLSPARALESAAMKGMVDGGLLRTLASGLWRKLVVANESGQGLVARNVSSVEKVSQLLAKSIPKADIGKSWVCELLLTLLYKRRFSIPALLRLTSFSVWGASEGDPSSVRDTLLELSRMELIQRGHGRFSSTRYGQRIIEREIPFERVDLDELRTRDDEKAEPKAPELMRNWESERRDYAEERVMELARGNGWATVRGTAQELLQRNVTANLSLWKARALLEEMVKEGLLVKSTYVRGQGRPTYVYRDPKGSIGLWIEERCGDCVFFARPYRRCRLWWAANLYGARGAYSKLGGLSPVGKERLWSSNTRIKPGTTACEHFTPKRKDFPITKAREKCLGCGTEIDSPIATMVRCSTCGTAYKPLSNRILVLYDYEHVFKAKYEEITGMSPPDKASAKSDPGYEGTTEWRDLIVLYPGETVRLGADGMYMKREGTGVFQRYDRIYQLVDYGSLAPQQTLALEKKGVRLLRHALQEGEQPGFQLYPSSEFVANLLWLNTGLALAKPLTESLLLSVIVATKRVASLGGRLLKQNIERQLLEYQRMKHETSLNSSKMLAYEARVNGSYWRTYKTMLRAVGLDFKSRVRDRFVRELVQSIRARARGYSPANSGINYLHQRRLVQCRRTNALSGIGWIGCEGVVHFAGRKPPIGLLLDLSDSFKLADREAFLNAALQRQVTREDFVSRIGRQGLRFYYPTASAVEKLEKVGSDADNYVVEYGGRDLGLTTAYQKYVESFVQVIVSRTLSNYEPFIYAKKEDIEWLESRGALKPRE